MRASRLGAGSLSLSMWAACAVWAGGLHAQGAPPPPPAPAPAPAPAPVRPVNSPPPATYQQQPASPPQQPPAAAPAAPDARLGGNGESCRARTDCQQGLVCIGGTCQWEGTGSVCEATADCKQPLVCMGQRCTDPNAPPPAPAYGQPAYGQTQYQPAPQYPAYPQGAQPGAYAPPAEKGPFDGTRFIIGAGFSGGPDWIWGGGFAGRTGFGMFDIKLGGLFERREISFVYAPVMYFPGVAHSIRLETANYHKLGGDVYWPIRTSIGGVFGNGGGAMLVGLDFLSFGMAAGPALFELNLAKIRLQSNFDFVEFGLLFGFTAHYGTPP